MKKILVVHTWGMGDLIMATPMMYSLYLSGYSVDVAILNTSKAIIEDTPFINEIFVIGSNFEFLKFFRKYDILVATAGTDPKKVKMLSKLLGVKRFYTNQQQKNIHRIDVNLETVAELLIKKTRQPYIARFPNQAVVQKYLKSDNKNIGFAIGSGITQKFKRWGIDKYVELIQRCNANTIVFIGPDEVELKNRLQQYGDFTIVEESLQNTIELIAHLDLLVGNDNGLMHIGYAVGIRTLTIYGMTNEKETGGYTDKNEAVFLEMECRPCFDSSSDRVGCKTLDCLKNLEVQKVESKCQQFRL